MQKTLDKKMSLLVTAIRVADDLLELFRLSFSCLLHLSRTRLIFCKVFKLGYCYTE